MLQYALPDLLQQQIQRSNRSNLGKIESTLNRQIYDIIRQAILDGILPANTKLPATRSLAKELQLSRNTVLAAYEQLEAEGYVTTAIGSGTYVAETFSNKNKSGDTERTGNAADHKTLIQVAPRRYTLSRRGHKLISDAGASDRQWGAFVAGVPDVSLFPHNVWARLLSKRWRNPLPELLTYAHQGGYMPLRRALAEHLRIVRSANCEASRIIITTGIHQALDLVARMLADSGDTAWIEDPGYWGTRSVFSSAGIVTIPIPVDKEGIAPDGIALQNPPRLIFVTPSHQYPLGTVMSMARRRMLLEYARQRDAWIIEDDYDSEFRFEGKPLASLQGLDQHDRVIYVGTFSKTLFPGMRLGYMIVPKALATQFATGLSEIYREGQLMQQAVLAEFIEEGHYSAHTRRMRQHYARRQSLLREALTQRFGKSWPISSQEAGLHMTMFLPANSDDLGISIAARTQGIIARPLSRYYHHGTGALKGLLLGYACVPEQEIAPAFHKLADVIEPALSHQKNWSSRHDSTSIRINEAAWSGA